MSGYGNRGKRILLESWEWMFAFLEALRVHLQRRDIMSD